MKTRTAIILFFLSLSVSAAGNFDFSSTTSYNARLDGAFTNDFLGRSVVAGDVNGDGIMDVIAGADGADNNGTNSGSVYVIFGSAALSSNIDMGAYYNVRFDGASAGDQIGYSVSCADINGDGKADILMGAPYADNNGSDSGSVYIVFGSASMSGIKKMDNAANYDARFDGAAANAYLSTSETTGDVNGDGKADLLLTSPSYGSGEAYLIYGASSYSPKEKPLSNSVNYDARFIAAAAGDHFGASTAIGDIDGDGKGEMLIASDQADTNGADSGAVYAIAGASSYSPKERNMANASYYSARFDGGSAGDQLGFSKGLAAGDVNGDGKKDLIMSSRFASNSGAASGSVYLIFGAAGITGNKALSNSANYDARFDGAAADDRLGSSVTAGDANGDNKADLLMGAYWAGNNGRANSGSQYLIYGSNAFSPKERGMSNSAYYDIRFDGASAGDGLGNACALDDVNGDNRADPIMAAYSSDNNGRTNSGSVYVYTGAAQPQVNSVSPNSKDQGWIGNIAVAGSSFESGARVSFNDPNIIVGSTTFVNSTSLNARINILPQTAAGGKNVIVANPSGAAGTGYVLFTVAAGGSGPIFSNIKFDGIAYLDGAAVSLGVLYPRIAGEVSDSNGMTSASVNFEMLISTNETYPNLSSFYTETSATGGRFDYPVPATRGLPAGGSNLILYAEDTGGHPTQKTVPINVSIAANPSNPINDVQVGKVGNQIVIQVDANTDTDAQLVIIGGNPTPVFVKNVSLTSGDRLKAMGVRTGKNNISWDMKNMLGEPAPNQVLMALINVGGRIVKTQKFWIY